MHISHVNYPHAWYWVHLHIKMTHTYVYYTCVYACTLQMGRDMARAAPAFIWPQSWNIKENTLTVSSSDTFVSFSSFTIPTPPPASPTPTLLCLKMLEACGAAYLEVLQISVWFLSEGQGWGNTSGWDVCRLPFSLALLIRSFCRVGHKQGTPLKRE